MGWFSVPGFTPGEGQYILHPSASDAPIVCEQPGTSSRACTQVSRYYGGLQQQQWLYAGKSTLGPLH